LTSCLLLPDLPLAIIFEVPLVVLFSSKCGARWPLAHVGEEPFKLMPLLANGYPTTSIVLVVFTFLAFASANHGVPGDKSWALGFSFGMPVNNPADFYRVRAFSAHPRPASQKTSAIYNVLASAFTNAKTSPDTIYRHKIGNHFSLSKCSSSEQLSSRHGIGHFNVVFSGGRPATTGAHCDYIT